MPDIKYLLFSCCTNKQNWIDAPYKATYRVSVIALCFKYTVYFEANWRVFRIKLWKLLFLQLSCWFSYHWTKEIKQERPRFKNPSNFVPLQLYLLSVVFDSCFQLHVTMKTILKLTYAVTYIVKVFSLPLTYYTSEMGIWKEL